jgi:uroporphyrinogen decarboxylase
MISLVPNDLLHRCPLLLVLKRITSLKPVGARGQQLVQVVQYWQRMIEQHLRRLLDRVGEAGVPRILFLQNAPHLVDAYAQLPAEVLAADWRLDLGAVQQRYPHRSVQGNIDPAILLAGPDATRSATEKLLRNVDKAGHIVNLGHGIFPTTPIDSVEALIQTVQEESR